MRIFYANFYKTILIILKLKKWTTNWVDTTLMYSSCRVYHCNRCVNLNSMINKCRYTKMSLSGDGVSSYQFIVLV